MRIRISRKKIEYYHTIRTRIIRAIPSTNIPPLPLPMKPTPDPTLARDIRISKALSYLLRHGAVKENLNIDDAGYIQVQELLNHNRMKCNKTTLQDLERIVANNEKQRFKMISDLNNPSELIICANQGHSIKTITTENLVKLTEPAQLPQDLFHGTYLNILPLIKQSGGLKIMTRNHIHLTNNVDYIRKSCNVMIFIDGRKCLDDGIDIYRSENNVYLTSGIDGILPIRYFRQVIKRPSDEIIDLNCVNISDPSGTSDSRNCQK